MDYNTINQSYRTFWTASFVLGIVMAGLMIHGVCVSYMKNPVVVTFQVAETQISSVPFPAITSMFMDLHMHCIIVDLRIL